MGMQTSRKYTTGDSLLQWRMVIACWRVPGSWIALMCVCGGGVAAVCFISHSKSHGIFWLSCDNGEPRYQWTFWSLASCNQCTSQKQSLLRKWLMLLSFASHFNMVLVTPSSYNYINIYIFFLRILLHTSIAQRHASCLALHGERGKQ